VTAGERIRALEAELAYRRSYDTGDFTAVGTVIGDLMAERDALKARVLALETLSEDFHARAEKAEARVEELEARFALEEEAAAELRGKDRG